MPSSKLSARRRSSSFSALEHQVSNPFPVSPIIEPESPTAAAPPVMRGLEHQQNDSIENINFHRRPSMAFVVDQPVSPTETPAPVLPSVSSYSKRHSARPASMHGPIDSAARDLYVSGNRKSFPSPIDTTASLNSMPSRDIGDYTFPATPLSSASSSASSRTRHPMDAFASYEMLRGQKDSAERRRGSEIFNQGKYEGRGFDTNRRSDPAQNVRIARGVSKIPLAPPVDVSIAANALRQSRRDSSLDSDKRFDHDWRARFSSISDEGTPLTSPANRDFAVSKDFSFPSRTRASHQTTTSLPAYVSYPQEKDLGDGDEDEGPYSEKTLYSDSADRKVTPHGWQSDESEIIAVPRYPSPSGSLSQSWSFRFKIFTARLCIVTVLFWQLSTWSYIAARIVGMVAVEQAYPSTFIAGWGFLAAEIFVALTMGIHSVASVFTYSAPGSAPKLRLKGDSNLPTVDVLIISSGQPDQIVFDCSIAAASIDYPTHRFRVFVIDPTGSTDLRAKILDHSKTQKAPHLAYYKRTLLDTESHQTRAGSINFGMKLATTIGARGPGEFIFVVDADMIVERNSLRAILPAVLGEANMKVGLVKTPAGFINLPRRLTQSTATLMDASEQPLCKSGFLLRRSALEQIGGYPTESWIADGMVTARFTAAGFSSSSLDEVLQFGCAKSSYGEQVAAMMIDGLAPLRTLTKIGFTGKGKTSLATKIAAFAPIISIGIYLVTIFYPFMFSYGGLLVLASDTTSLNVLLQLNFLAIVTGRLHEIMWTWSTGLVSGSPRRKFQTFIFKAPYTIVSFLFALLPTRLRGFSKSDIDIAVRSKIAARQGFWERLGWFLLDPHTGFLVSFCGSVGVCLWRAFRDFNGGMNLNQSILTILLTVGWPSMIWVDFLIASFVPFSCLLFPSLLLTEPRDSFVIRDHFSNVTRPRHSYKTTMPLKVHRFPEWLSGSLLVIYAAASVAVALYTDLLN